MSEQSHGFDHEFWIKVGDILDEENVILDALKRVVHNQGLEQTEIDAVFDTVEHEV